MWLKAIEQRIISLTSAGKDGERSMDFLAYFPDSFKKYKALTAYFTMKEDQQAVLTRFMLDDAFGASMVRCLSYLVTARAEHIPNCTTFSIVTTFNRRFSSCMDPDNVDSLLKVGDLDTVLYFTGKDFFSLEPPLFARLLLWGIINQVTVWSDKGVMDILEDQYLHIYTHITKLIDDICSSQQLTLLCEELRAKLKCGREYPGVENLLVRILMNCNALTADTMRGICDVLFENNEINSFAVIDLLDRMKQNFPFVRDYVLSRFCRSVATECPQFLYAAAAISLPDFAQGDTPPAKVAQEYVCTGDIFDIFLGLAVISLLAWAQNEKIRGAIFRKPIQLTEDFCCRLKKLLQKKSIAFPAAVNAAEDLASIGLLQANFFADDHFRENALSILQTNPQNGRAAETLLSLIPGQSSTAQEVL